MKILVCGGREYSNREYLRDYLDDNYYGKITHLIAGGAAGADKLATEWAIDRGIQHVVCPALWVRHGKAAGPLRNAAMLALLTHADTVVAFEGGSGTAHMIKIAKQGKFKVDEVKEAAKDTTVPI